MIAKLLTKVLRDTRGNVTLILALAIIPLIAAVGVAVDLGNATRVRLALQDATDSAVLALGRDGLSTPDGQLPGLVKQYINASYNYGEVPYTITKLNFDRATVTAELETRAEVPTSFMGMFGFTATPVTASAVSRGAAYEIAMVLDNSGSMKESAGSGGAKINALKDASREFVDVMFGSNAVSQRVAISVVPFAASVNVGTANASASWMDKGVSSSIQREDFDKPLNRDTVYTAMRNVSWAGCVMQRPAPYDLDDTPASGGDTLFVKWFAPDEPDPGEVKGKYDNSYLDDTGGNCSTALPAASEKQRQQNTCKYNGATPDTSGGKGPNLLCTTRAITPLTNTRSTLDTALNSMKADGNTNIVEGLLWGWRTLSPTAPFTEGKSYSAANNRKVVILMTDGENVVGGTNNINISQFTAFGFAEKGRIGSPATPNEATNRARLDAKTLTVCSRAKAQGIVVYTIAFGSGAKGSAPMLRACATDPSYFYEPKNSSELRPVFLQIAESINKLRIAA